MAKSTVAVIANPLAAGKKVILLGVTGLNDNEKATMKDVRGSNGGYFSWAAAFKAYAATHSDDLELWAKQFAAVHDALIAKGVSGKPAEEKAPKRPSADTTGIEALLAKYGMEAGDDD
jgi:hypothetical protein